MLQKSLVAVAKKRNNSLKKVEVKKMNNKPICGEWHSNDVMPNGDKLCIFEIKVGEASEILIGYKQCDEIVRENSCYEFVCFLKML